MAGWWSYSEFVPPMRCPLADACPGVRLAVAQTGGSPHVDTQLCAAGYAGVRCSQCASSYYEASGRCYYCGASTDQSRDLAILLLVSLCAVCALAACVAFMRARALALSVEALVVLQGAAMVGVDAVQSAPFAKEQLSLALSGTHAHTNTHTHTHMHACMHAYTPPRRVHAHARQRGRGSLTACSPFLRVAARSAV